MATRSPQLKLLAKEKSAYGGDLLKTRAGRRRGRPLSTRETMHLVLRSTKAKGAWSFRSHDLKIRRIVEKFSNRYGVRVLSLANVGNHLHLQIKLSNRFTYRPFIRAVTAAIAMAVTGRTRWTRSKISNGVGPAQNARGTKESHVGEGAETTRGREKFWDYRPYTRVVESFLGFLNLKDYLRINELEGVGYRRDEARFMIKIEKTLWRTG